MQSIFLRFPQGRAKALTLSYDDGVEQDIKLLDIMKRYGLKGTFNINSGLYAAEGKVYQNREIHRRMTERQVTEAYKNSGQEIAVHSLTHPALDQMPAHMAVNEIIKDRENLEKQFGTIVRGMAYPYGTFNNQVIDVLNQCGIVYARTVISTNDFRIPKDWLRLTATCHHKAPELQSLVKMFIEDKINGNPYLFYLWGHSYEFEADNNWNVIEDFAECIGNRDDIWYATNMEVYEYIEAFNGLVFSMDGMRVKNPSGRKVWFEYSCRIIEIDAGAMIEI